jgi:hypothetical protein
MLQWLEPNVVSAVMSVAHAVCSKNQLGPPQQIKMEDYQALIHKTSEGPYHFDCLSVYYITNVCLYTGMAVDKRTRYCQSDQHRQC